MLLTMLEHIELKHSGQVILMTTSTIGVTPCCRESAFIRNRELPVHRWVPVVASFSAQIPDDCPSNYLKEAVRYSAGSRALSFMSGYSAKAPQ
jgi:hypothetical protein